MSKYIITSAVNFCFNNPGKHDSEYSIAVHATPDGKIPIEQAKKKIKDRNCWICGHINECAEIRRNKCKVKVVAIEKVE